MNPCLRRVFIAAYHEYRAVESNLGYCVGISELFRNDVVQHVFPGLVHAGQAYEGSDATRG